jgi:hypothetical protein
LRLFDRRDRVEVRTASVRHYRIQPISHHEHVQRCCGWWRFHTTEATDESLG